jgi:uncharacterized membrane protein YeiH
MELLATYHLDQVIELSAIFIAGLAGGLAGIRKGFDMFGVVVLAWVASLFGGVLRDVMIGSIPPVGISNWRFFTSAVLAGIIVCFTYKFVARWQKAIVVLDAFSLALFVWIGTVKGLEAGMGYLTSAIVGVLTGVGGGVVRDLFTNNVPLVLADRQLYAIPACVGAAATVFFVEMGWQGIWTTLVVVFIVAGFRLIALKLKWAVPAPHPATTAIPLQQPPPPPELR